MLLGRYLYQTPPMHRIHRDGKKLLADEDLVPSALIRWGYEGFSGTVQGPFLEEKMVV